MAGFSSNSDNNGQQGPSRLHQVTTLIAETRRRHGSGDAMIYFGNRHDTYPSMLLRDPHLKPNQMILYLIMHQQFSSVSGGPLSAPIPDNVILSRQLKITSRTTLAQCFKLLRATRWLSLIDPQIRDSGGRYKGNVYALHGEPCSLDDALFLDSGYLQLVESIAANTDEQMRMTGQAAEAGIDQQISKRVHESHPAHEPHRSLPALDALEQRITANQKADEYETQGKFERGLLFDDAMSDGESMNRSNNETMSKKWTRFQNSEMEPCPKNGHGDDVQKLDTVQNLDTVQILYTNSRSGSYINNIYINNKTTTPPTSPPSSPKSGHRNTPSVTDQAESVTDGGENKAVDDTGKADFDWDSLQYPERLTPDEIALSRRFLLFLNDLDQAQTVLDELSGRMKTKEQTGGKIHDRLAYMGRLINLANQDKLQPSSAALLISAERQRKAGLIDYQRRADEELKRKYEQIQRDRDNS